MKRCIPRSMFALFAGVGALGGVGEDCLAGLPARTMLTVELRVDTNTSSSVTDVDGFGFLRSFRSVPVSQCFTEQMSADADGAGGGFIQVNAPQCPPTEPIAEPALCSVGWSSTNLDLTIRNASAYRFFPGSGAFPFVGNYLTTSGGSAVAKFDWSHTEEFTYDIDLLITYSGDAEAMVLPISFLISVEAEGALYQSIVTAEGMNTVTQDGDSIAGSAVTDFRWEGEGVILSGTVTDGQLNVQIGGITPILDPGVADFDGDGRVSPCDGLALEAALDPMCMCIDSMHPFYDPELDFDDDGFINDNEVAVFRCSLDAFGVPDAAGDVDGDCDIDCDDLAEFLLAEGATSPAGMIYRSGADFDLDGDVDADDRAAMFAQIDLVACNPFDFNLNGCVGSGDLAQVVAAWGACMGCPEDTNGDGVVDATDLAAVIAVWNCP